MGACKLVIKSYKDNSYGSEIGEFVSTINPANLNISSGIKYNDSCLAWNTNWQLQYNSSIPRLLAFSLIFDNTGVFPNASIDVKTQISALEGLLCSCSKETREPSYVRVIWGMVDFKGRLSKMDVSYSMFKADGTPIKAQADIVVIEQKQAELTTTSQKENKSDDNKNDTTSNSNKTSKTENNKQAQNELADNSDNNNSDNSSESNQNVNDDNQSTDDSNEKQENTEEETKEKNNPNDEKQENTEEETKEKNNPNDEKNNATNKTPSISQIVKAGDSLPGVLKNNSMLQSLIDKVARFNVLDSLKTLTAGMALLLPLSVAALSKSLLSKLLALIKRGVTFIKKKGSSLLNKVKDTANNAKSKTKNIWNKAKSKSKDTANNAKSKTKNIWNKAKSRT